MSTGFSFGQKPNETPTFGQPSFGTPQFGSPAATTTQSQFSSPFASKPITGGFQYSTPTTTSTFGSSFNFNTSTPQQNANQPTSSFGFNTTTAPSFSMGSNAFAFSTPTSAPQTTNLFGTATSIPTLGTPKTTVPTFNTPSGGLFGTVPSTTPATQAGFGMSANTGPSFGIQQSTAPKMQFGTPTPGGFSFGPTVTTSATNLTFAAVASPTPTTKFAYGPSTTSAAPVLNFGAIQSTPATTLNFQPASTSIPQGLTFSSASTVPQTGLNFSAPSTTPTVGLSFGTQASTTAKTGISFTSAPSSFGTSSAPTGGLTFSASTSVPTSAPTLNFMTPASTTTSLGLAFPSTNTAATTSTSTIGLNFLTSTSVPSTTTIGLSASTTTAPAKATAPNFGTPIPPPTTTTISFGATPISSSVPVLNFGGTPLTTTSSAASTSGTTTLGLGGIKPTSTSSTTPGFNAPPSLGGLPKSVDTSSSKPGTDQSQLSPKDQVLPNELMQTVENFKKFVKEQKGYSSEIGRFSIKDLRKVEQDVDVINNCMNEVENQLRKNKAVADKIKMDSAKDLQNAEMAQRTFDTPVGLQYENTAPFNYFLELSDHFETEMQDLKIHIESVAKYIEILSVHSQVELQKEQYLNLRKKMANDYTNVFEKQNKESDALEMLLEKLVKQQPTISNSPTPFTSLRSSQVQAVGQNNAMGNPTVSTLGPPVTTGFNIGGAPNMSLFGTSTTNTPSLFNTSSASNSFQLQKPPVGNKRGKP
ncbi:hypothetical protein FQR65_LT07543 [Abscondita terminalis]|nr:hypothetical protein FQR65_LT07543 [Abscondita terminalis]